MSRYVGIAQNWKMDEGRLGAQIDVYSSSANPFQILLFPEGRNLNPESREATSRRNFLLPQLALAAVEDHVHANHKIPYFIYIPVIS